MLEVISRTGGPSAISMRLWAWLSPVAVIGTFLSSMAKVGQTDYPLVFTGAVLSYLASGLVFWLATLVWRRNVMPKMARPVIAIGFFALAGFTVALSFQLFISVALAASSEDFWQSALARVWIGVFWSCVLAIALDSKTTFDKAGAEISSRVEQLEGLLEERPKAIEKIRTQALRALNRVITQSLKSGKSENITLAADQVSKRVSRRILASWDKDLELERRPGRPVRLQPLLGESLRHPAKLMRTGLIVGLGLGVQGLIWQSIAGVANALLTGVLVIATGYLLHLMQRVPTWLRAAVLFMGIGLNAWSSSVIAEALDFTGYSLPGTTIGGWILASFMTVQQELDANRTRSLDESKAVARAYQWHVNKLRQELWLESKRVARIVHGDVQSRLRAAALNFDLLDKEGLEKLRNECLLAIGSESEGTTIETFLSESRALWGASMALEIDDRRGAISKVSGDSVAVMACVEILREGISNAARHSGTSKVLIQFKSLSEQGRRSILIRISHAGILSKTAKKGLGSAFVDDLASSWSLAQEGNHVVLEAMVPYTEAKWPREESNFRHTV